MQPDSEIAVCVYSYHARWTCKEEIRDGAVPYKQISLQEGRLVVVVSRHEINGAYRYMQDGNG